MYKQFKRIFDRLTGNNSAKRQSELQLAQLRELDELFNLFNKSTAKQVKSHAQLAQDIVVLLHTQFKPDGYFVEFGATDGISLSNTYLLEKHYAWKGIVAEPSPSWQKALAANRSCSIDHRCVWKHSNQIIEFREAAIGTLSTIEQFSYPDKHGSNRNGKLIEVETISLNDLLDQHNAPKCIDYLSIDTEGSEYEILQSFDFSKYSISIISCEHNFTEQREKIFSLLTSQGYQRKYTTLSKFDDWYFLQT